MLRPNEALLWDRAQELAINLANQEDPYIRRLYPLYSLSTSGNEPYPALSGGDWALRADVALDSDRNVTVQFDGLILSGEKTALRKTFKDIKHTMGRFGPYPYVDGAVEDRAPTQSPDFARQTEFARAFLPSQLTLASLRVIVPRVTGSRHIYYYARRYTTGGKGLDQLVGINRSLAALSRGELVLGPENQDAERPKIPEKPEPPYLGWLYGNRDTQY